MAIINLIDSLINKLEERVNDKPKVIDNTYAARASAYLFAISSLQNIKNNYDTLLEKEIVTLMLHVITGKYKSVRLPFIPMYKLMGIIHKTKNNHQFATIFDESELIFNGCDLDFNWPSVDKEYYISGSLMAGDITFYHKSE